MFAALVTTAAVVASLDTAPAQTIPNPVTIFYGFEGPNKAYSVDCWGYPGQRGTWLGITGPTYTQQEALIYTTTPPPPGSDPRTMPSIMYCFGPDGKPGMIQGAPPGTLLVPGTRIVTYTSVQIVMPRVNGKVSAASVPLLETTEVSSGPDGVIIQYSAHDMTVYPAGSTLTIGYGRSVGFFRPGVLTKKTTPSNASGCTVSIVNGSGATTTRHYSQDCGAIEDSKPWTKQAKQ